MIQPEAGNPEMAQEQNGAVWTAIVNVPPEGGSWTKEGLTLKVQTFAAAWVIKTGWPAMDTLAERLAPVFAATTRIVVTGPALGDGMAKVVIQIGKPAIDQEQDGLTWIVIGKEPPDAGAVTDRGLTLMEQSEESTRMPPLLESET